MSKPNKNRISTSGGSSSGLNTPFAGLELGGLPSVKPEQPPQEEQAAASARAAKPRKLGRVVLRREKAHRGGKTVTVVYDFPAAMSDAALEELGRKLRSACGCGGTVKDRTIEVQGDQPAKVRQLLAQEGFTVAG